MKKKKEEWGGKEVNGGGEEEEFGKKEMRRKICRKEWSALSSGHSTFGEISGTYFRVKFYDFYL
jgi:hypothetical protein